MRIVKISDVFEIKYGNSFELVNLINVNSSNCVNFISRTERITVFLPMLKRFTDIEPTIKNYNGRCWRVSFINFFEIQPYYTGFHVLVLSLSENERCGDNMLMS